MVTKDKKTNLKQGKTEQKRSDESIEMFGVTLSGTHKLQVLKKIFSQRKQLLHVVTLNPEFVMESRTNRRFKDVLEKADLVVADGWGIVWAARILRNLAIERITGNELTLSILSQANTRGEKLFLLGAAPGVSEKAAEMMKKMYPNVEIASYSGARTVKVEKSEEASMTIARINAFEPDYLLVAYGSPWQDMWIEENRPYLRTRVAIGVGGVLDEWAGVVKETPEWLDRLGGKWLFRLFTQPWRWKRILRVLGFGGLVLYHKLID